MIGIAMDTRVGRIAFPVLLSLALVVFLIDISLPRGATVAICYLPLVTIAAGYRSRRPMMVLAVMCSVLTVVDVYLSPANDLPAWVSLNNRGLTLASMWFVVFLAGTRLREYWIGEPLANRDPSGPWTPAFPAGVSRLIAKEPGSNPGTVQVRPRWIGPASVWRGESFAKRIAIVAHSNAPWTTPYAQYFQNCHREVRVISFHPDPVEGVETVFVGREPFDAERGKGLFITRVPEVRRRLEEFQPDVVLGCYLISNGLTAALAWRGPLIVSARGGCVLRQTRTGEPGRATIARRRMLGFVCSRADRVHAVSEEIAEALTQLGVSPAKIDCFPLGVDVATFPFSPAARANGEPVRIVCVRQQEPVYQNHVILRAVAELLRRGRAVRCDMIGGGSLLEERRAEARSLGIEDAVRFAGHVSAREIPGLISQGHIYVSASSSDGTSSSLLEAMATGLFPVVSDIRANRVWVRNGENGMLFKVGDVGQLVEAIEAAIDRPELAAAAARSNRQQIEHDGDRRVLNGRMLELLDRVCALRAAV